MVSQKQTGEESKRENPVRSQGAQVDNAAGARTVSSTLKVFVTDGTLDTSDILVMIAGQGHTYVGMGYLIEGLPCQSVGSLHSAY